MAKIFSYEQVEFCINYIDEIVNRNKFDKTETFLVMWLNGY